MKYIIKKLFKDDGCVGGKVLQTLGSFTQHITFSVGDYICTIYCIGQITEINKQGNTHTLIIKDAPWEIRKLYINYIQNLKPFEFSAIETTNLSHPIGLSCYPNIPKGREQMQAIEGYLIDSILWDLSLSPLAVRGATILKNYSHLLTNAKQRYFSNLMASKLKSVIPETSVSRTYGSAILDIIHTVGGELFSFPGVATLWKMLYRGSVKLLNEYHRQEDMAFVTTGNSLQKIKAKTDTYLNDIYSTVPKHYWRAMQTHEFLLNRGTSSNITPKDKADLRLLREYNKAKALEGLAIMKRAIDEMIFDLENMHDGQTDQSLIEVPANFPKIAPVDRNPPNLLVSGG